MSERDPDHPLRQDLVVTQNQLQHALEEVCEDVAIAAAPTQELIRIEETLSFAVEAAKQAISLRQRLDAESDSAPVS
ncbi:MAG TPA: hypothetical protein VFO66_14625 [Gemmatimonadaceae bacterium]|nr:hypothetical protein [Gemmatimonadaceae bacterium]